MSVSGESKRSDSNGNAPLGASVTRVRRASEQVYDQLRSLITSGELKRGQKLPSEALLAQQFGVSRGTAREALKMLSSENLVRTTKGATGGSFVTLPTPDHISEFLQSNIALLNEAQDVSPNELLEVRDLLEGFAARLAAKRRSEEDLEILRAFIISDPELIGSETQYSCDDGFHGHLLSASGNTLLHIAAQPVFGVVQENFRRREMTHEAMHQVNEDHRLILEAVESGDAELAEKRMHAHLDGLRPHYVRLWRSGITPTVSS
ncbi:MAG: FadR family transcriptional regulator [Solirubrobacterales bacterium]|nr:FadR family transcriptional regulator [Solirubrobacterales bacterium]